MRLLNLFMLLCLLPGICKAQLSQDELELLAIHHNILMAILNEDLDLLYSNVADNIFTATDGTVKWESKAVAREGMRKLFGRYNFNIYEDIGPPYVKVSQDGSMGWVLAHIKVEGETLETNGSRQALSNPLTAWIEVYEKIDGKWTFIGSAGSSENTGNVP